MIFEKGIVLRKSGAKKGMPNKPFLGLRGTGL